MTFKLLDEIQALADCRQHCERAEWLLTCRMPILVKYEINIRSRLQNAGFVEGVRYLDLELEAYRAPRIDGHTVWTPERTGARETMFKIAATGERLIMPDDLPAPDHSATDL